MAKVIPKATKRPVLINQGSFPGRTPKAPYRRRGTKITFETYFVSLSFFFPFLGSLWSRGWENDLTSALPIGMPLSPITRATVVIFSELGFAASV